MPRIRPIPLWQAALARQLQGLGYRAICANRPPHPMTLGNCISANPLGRWLVAIGLTQLAALSQTAGSDTTVELRGRVTNWTGQPLAGAVVAFQPREGVTTADLLSAPPHETDAEGRFAINVPALTKPGSAKPRLVVVSRGMAAREPALASFEAINARTKGLDGRLRKPVDLGDIKLIRGTRLFGRVRDTDGRPVPGVNIVAKDLLDGHKLLRGTPLHCVCRAKSNDSGIFELPATLPNAVQLTVVAPNYLRQQIAPVAVGTPLEITLTPGGTIAGRALDDSGSGVAGAQVRAEYERRGPVTTTHTAADGSFALPLEYAGRYRLRIDADGQLDDETDEENPRLKGHSPVLEGSQENLELTVEPPANEKKLEKIRIRAVLADSGAPINNFRAAGVWHQFASNNNNYLEYLFARALPNSKPARTGVAEIAAPATNSTNGILRVLAEGFAPATKRDVDWEKPDEPTEKLEVVIEMVPQSTASGTVVDAQTGQPLAGAKVWAIPRADVTQGLYNQNSPTPADAVTTGPDGKFVLTQLGEGEWQALVHVADRPTVAPVDFDLEQTEHRTDLAIQVLAGTTVQGRITGINIADGSKVFLHRLPRMNFGINSGLMSVRPTQIARQLLDADGAFRFDGIPRGQYVLAMNVPAKPRCGPGITLPIEPLRVRGKGLQGDFDASEDVPGQISGIVRFPQIGIPFDRLVVVARQIADRNGTALAIGRNNYTGPRSFVGPDGRFALTTTRGRYLLALIDLSTNLVLAHTTEPIPSHGSADCEVSIPLTQVRVVLAPESVDGPMALVDRIEVRLQHEGDNQAAKLLNANINRDYGCGIDVPPGVSEVTLALPPGRAVILARNNIVRLHLGNNFYNQPPLGDSELEIDSAADSGAECVLTVSEPPEVPGDNGNANQGLPEADK